LGTIIGGIMVIFMTQITYVQGKRAKEKLIKLLSNNFEKNLINSKEDIIFLLNSINREYDRNYSLVNILEDYIVYITREEININNLNDIHSLIKKIIEIENQEMPFNNVPEQEKRILKNISDNLKNKYFESINTDLQELGSVIAARNKVYEKTNKINKLSLPIAIAGTIVAIIFGIISFNNVDYKKIEDMNRKLVETNVKDKENAELP
jgi:hypothetical protein